MWFVNKVRNEVLKNGDGWTISIKYYPIMPRTSRKTRQSDPPSTPDVTVAFIAQLTKLPLEILRLHLSSHHLVSTGTKAAMARRLYDSIHPSAASSSTLATSTTQFSMTPAASTIQPTTTPAQPFPSIPLLLQSIATILPIPQSVASFTTPRMSELALLFNQFLCHATTT